MAQHLTAAGLQHLMPPCWDSIDAYVAAQEQQHKGEPGLEQLQHPQQVERPGQVQQAQQQQQQQLQGEGAIHKHLLQLQLHEDGQVSSCADDAGSSDLAAASGGSDDLQPQDAATASSSSSSSSIRPVPGVRMTNATAGNDHALTEYADTPSSSSSGSGGGAVLSGSSTTAATGGSSSIHVRAQDQATATGGGSSSNSGGSVFVKHKRGVKGQAVYIARTMQQLLQLQQRLKGSSRDFIVQQEVPPLLLQGRKFVLRVHVLAVPQLPQLDSGDAAAVTVRVYVHEDVIVLQHAQPYNPASNDSAVHISSKGRHHPVPVLLAGSVLPSDLQESIWQQLQGLAVHCIGAVSQVLLPSCVHPGVALYHLFGFDCMVNTAGQVVMLEVNSYPAIASGTMRGVDVDVYTRLIGDLVRLLVLPVTDGLAPEPQAGGFVEVKDMA
jgi:hypothetical protein